MVYFTAKHGIPRLLAKYEKPGNTEEEQSTVILPSIGTLASCLNSGEAPKAPLIPDLLYWGGRTVIAGRTGVGKSIIIDQLCLELSRGYGEFVGSNATPHKVILIDGEMEDDDYKRRFEKNLAGTENIIRVSDFEFKTIKQFTDFVKDMVTELQEDTVIAIDNIVSLFPNPTGAQMFEFYGNLKRIQKEASVNIAYIIADHISKVPMGQPLDESHIAGSANVTRFATNIAIIDWNARGKGFRYMKCLKQRKNAPPDEVTELEVDENDFLHFAKLGVAMEEKVLWTPSNRKHFNQEVDIDEEEDEEAPLEDRRGERWTDKDTQKLKELATTLDTPDKETIGLVMDRHPQYIYKQARKFGVKLMSKPRGRKPKQKEQANEEQ